MLDTYQNKFRILQGVNAGSSNSYFALDLNSGQLNLSKYTGSGAFLGTAAATLAVDTGGNVITVTPGSATLTGGSTNYVARWASASTLTTGSLFDTASKVGINTITPSYTLDVSGDIRATGAVYANANGTMYFRGGDDAELWDINVVNTIGVYGQQDQTVGSIKLGSGGGTISGKSTNIGIGTIAPNARLDVSGSAIISGSLIVTQGITGSFTGSLIGSASYATSASNAFNAVSASYILNAASASYALSASNAQTASYIINALSASWATNVNTASWANNVITAITASTLYSSQNYYVTASFTGSNYSVVQINTSSFASTFIRYTIISASNARSGDIRGVWIPSTTNINFDETTTTEIGNAKIITPSLILSQSQAQLVLTVGIAGTWNFRGYVMNL